MRRDCLLDTPNNPTDAEIQRCKSTIDALQHVGIAGSAQGVIDTVWAPAETVRELKVQNQIAVQQAKLTDDLTSSIEAKADAALWQSRHNSWIESDATYRGAHIVGAEVAQNTNAVQSVAGEVFLLNQQLESLRQDLAFNRAQPEPKPDAIVRQIDPDSDLFAALGVDSLRFDLLILPDPRVPRHRRAYELALEAVSAAMQDSGYAFDRYSFPWQSYLDPNTSSNAADGAADDGRYGLMVYRPVHSAAKKEWRGFFTVLETESYGVQAKSLTAALARIEGECGNAPGCTNDSEVSIFGGQFSATSDWFKRDAERSERTRSWRLAGRSARPIREAQQLLEEAQRHMSPPLVVAAKPRELGAYRQQLARLATVEQFLEQARALDGCTLSTTADPWGCKPRLCALKKSVKVLLNEPKSGRYVQVDEMARSGAKRLLDVELPEGKPFTWKPVSCAHCKPSNGRFIVADRSYRPTDICPTQSADCAKPSPKVLYVPENFAELRAASKDRLAKLREQSRARVFSSRALLELGETQENGSEYPDQRLSALNSVAVEQQLLALSRQLEAHQPAEVTVWLSEVRDRIFIIELVRRALPFATIIDPQPDVLLAHPSVLHATRGVRVVGPALSGDHLNRTFSTANQFWLWRSIRAIPCCADTDYVARVVSREGLQAPEPDLRVGASLMLIVAALVILWVQGEFWPRTPPIAFAPSPTAQTIWYRFWPVELRTHVGVGSFAAVILVAAFVLPNAQLHLIDGGFAAVYRLQAYLAMDPWDRLLDLLGLSLTTISSGCLFAFFFALSRMNKIAGRLRLLVQVDDQTLQKDWSAITSEAVLFVRSQVLMTRRTIGKMQAVAFGTGTPPNTFEEWLGPVLLGYRDTRDHRERVRIVLAHAIVGATEKLVFAVFAAAAAIGLVWVHPLAHRDEIVLVSLLVIVVASILFIRLQISLERNPFSSRLLCNGTDKFEWNTAVMVALLMPVLISVFSIAVVLSPGVLSWSGGLFEPLFSFLSLGEK